MNIVFSSRVENQCREELEDLLFFNPRQSRVRSGILDSLERFGQPRLEQQDGRLLVKVGDQEAQTLFAYDSSRKKQAPVGVIVFLRTNPQEMAVLHVAVDPDYALQGKHSGVGLGVTLVEKVKEIAARIVGVQRIVFFYRQDVIIRLK